MAKLAYIINSYATMRAEHVPAFNRVAQRLKNLTGVYPLIKAGWQTDDNISGGSRDLEMAIRAGTGAPSDHYEDNENGFVAVDIDNQRFFRNVLGDALFEQILADEGFFNQTIDGDDFPSEPWHFAKHVRITAAGEIGELIDTTTAKKEDIVTYGITATTDDKDSGIKKGFTFIGAGTEPLVWVSNPGPETINGVVIAQWDAASINTRIGQFGMRGSGVDLNKVFAKFQDAIAKPSKPIYFIGK